MTRLKGALHEDRLKFFIISRSVKLRMRNVSGKVVERIQTHILYSREFFSKIMPFMK